MTYRELFNALAALDDNQLSMDVTVELDLSDEYLPAEFRICGWNHDVLQDGHPVIYVADF